MREPCYQNTACARCGGIKFNLKKAVGVASLAALFLLAATSTDYAVKKMGRKWFTLHKLVYLAYPLIIAHAYSIGTDFGKSGLNAYSGSFLIIAAATLLLEAARAYVSFSKARQKAANPPVAAPPQI